ncbi:unnamed protein product [Meganyctiphanes norvegica]|uniref:Uncharacterized protein n=1 Tax=Meganyctiphanes norvegica TaxID=48144 RepID=A0AAV2RLL8_MEGNR
MLLCCNLTMGSPYYHYHLFIILILFLGAMDHVIPMEISLDSQVVPHVEGVEGDQASIPCGLHPDDPKDKVTLILWYKDGSKDPIYSYDTRRTVYPSESHHVKDSLLKDRVQFRPSLSRSVPHRFILQNLRVSDTGRYSCRVDFMMAQSSTRAAYLKVVAPVSSLVIKDHQGRDAPPVLQPIPEGGTLNVTCIATGGRPAPKVTWWVNNAEVDDGWVVTGPGVVSNNLVITPLDRAHSHAQLTCKALTSPVAIRTVNATIDMHLRPTKVKISGGAVNGWVRAKDALDLTCTATGSRPQPVITWYKGAHLVKTENTARKEVSAVGGVSHARIRVDRKDNGARVSCRAVNPAIRDHMMQDTIKLNVTYRPEVEIRMGVTPEGHVVKEGTDFILTCHVDANPQPNGIVFTHEGRTLRQEVSSGVMISGSHLAISKVTRDQAGAYGCRATNQQGTGESKPLNITVLFAPVCADSRDVWADPGNQVTATCRVIASPPVESFSWVWRTSSYSHRVSSTQVEKMGLSSTVTFSVPRDNITEAGPKQLLGSLQCWAQNNVGRQAEPCTVAVRRPAPPAAPVNCTLKEIGRKEVLVSCAPGDESSMPQTYRLQILEQSTRKIYINETSSVPRFQVRGLTAGKEYMVYVSSHTPYGRSPYRLVEAFTFKTAENRKENEEAMEWETIAMFAGAGAGAVLVILVLVCVVRLKMNKSSEHKCSRRTDSEETTKEKDIVGPKVVKPTPAKAETQPFEPKEEIKIVKEPEPILTSKISPPLQPIIKQPSTSSPPLQPIIKANGRSEKSNITQGRTVLFVEPPKKHSGILLNKNEVPPRNTYDPVYPGRSRLSMKGTNGEVPHMELPRDIHRKLPRDLPRNLSQDVPHLAYPRLRDRSYSSGMYHGREGDYHDPPPMGRRPPLMREHSISRDPREPIMRTDPPMRRYRNSMEDPFGGGDLRSQQFLSSSSTALSQEPGFHPPPRGPRRSGSGHSKHLPPREARMAARDPNMMRDPHISSRDPRLLRDPQHPSRDPHLPPREKMSMQDRHLAQRAGGHILAFPPRTIKREYDHIPPCSPPFHPPSIMKKSPSVSAYVGHHYDDSPAVRQEHIAYRSLPRPSRRGEREALYKYSSLDRRFDLPFSGSLPRPEPRFASDEAIHQRHYNSGSPHHRFADEKNYHLYHDKEKKQDGMVDEIDESFV